MKGWAQKTLAGMTLEQKLGQLMVSFLDHEADIRGLARAGALGGLYGVAGRTVRETTESIADLQREAAIPSAALLGLRDRKHLRRRNAAAVADGGRRDGRRGACPSGGESDRPRGRRDRLPLHGLAGGGHQPPGQSDRLHARLRRGAGHGDQDGPGVRGGRAGRGRHRLPQALSRHGNIDSDTHMVLPTLPFDRERMDRVELVPYRPASAPACGPS